MLLQDSKLYTIELKRLTEEECCEYSILFCPEHPIFKGHFPNCPIVPGACLVQIAEELLSQSLNTLVHFTAIKNLKFRKPITPDISVSFSISKTNDDQVSVLIHTNLDNYAQFSATYMRAHTNV